MGPVCPSSSSSSSSELVLVCPPCLSSPNLVPNPCKFQTTFFIRLPGTFKALRTKARALCFCSFAGGVEWVAPAQHLGSHPLAAWGAGFRCPATIWRRFVETHYFLVLPYGPLFSAIGGAPSTVRRGGREDLEGGMGGTVERWIDRWMG